MPRRIRARMQAFRNYQVAAPLKHSRGDRRRRRRQPFRNYQVAAPLKHGGTFGDGKLIPFFPQLSSCGPIEARPPAPSPRAWRTFRNYQVAAPLKRAALKQAAQGLFAAFRNYQVAAPLKRPGSGQSTDNHRSFPQLSSCGPIEAVQPASWPASFSPFRNYQVAAPLKPAVIEAAFEILVSAFRNYQVAAPLKPRSRSKLQAEHSLSATIKLRPH